MPILAPMSSTGDLNKFGLTIAPERQATDVDPRDLTRDQFDALSMRVYNRVNNSNAGMSSWEHVGRWAAGTSIDLADTLWSTPLNPFGERGDVWSLASPEEKDYYDRNKGLIEGSSAVVGGLATAVAAEALVIPRIAGALASSTALTGTAAWRASKAWNVATRMRMLTAQRAAAEAGEAYGILGTSSGRAFLANRAVAGAAAAIRTAPIEYALMWNNEAFNSKEWSREGFWIGVGAAVGGAAGSIGARAAVRKYAGTQEIRDLRAKPFALAGASNDLLSTEYLDQAGLVEKNAIQLKESANTTEFLVASRSANPQGYDEAANNATQLNSLRNQFKGYATDSLQKVVSQGVNGVQTLKAPVKAIPEIQHIVEDTAQLDPFLFHGMAEGGFPTTSLKQAREDRALKIESIKKEADVASGKGLQQEAMRLNRLQRTMKQQDEVVLINDSWMNPDSELAKEAVDFKPDIVKSQLIRSSDSEAISINMPHAGKVMLDASLTPLDGRGAAINVEKLSIKDRFSLNEAAVALVNNLTRKDAKIKFKLTDKGAKSWFSLDMAAEILDKGGSIEWATKNMKLATVDDIKRQSLRLKSRAALAEAGDMGAITAEMRFKYNLPAPTALERLEDPAGDGFKNWLVMGAKDEGSTREMAAGLGEYRAVQGIDLLPPTKQPQLRIDGDMLRFNRDKKGNWLRPMLGYFDPRSSIQPISEAGHSMAMTTRKAEKTYLLMTNKTHVGELANDLVAMPELRQAQDVSGLHGDQMTGLGSGVAQAAGEVLPQRFRARDAAPVLAATKLQEATERHGLATFKKLMDATGMQAVVTKVTSAGQGATRTMLDQFFSLRSGWDLAEEALPAENGLYKFVLEDTPGNRKRLGMSAEDEWDDYTYMPNERMNQDIVVNADAYSAIKAYNQLTESMRAADNALRTSRGLNEIKRRNFYTPPPNTRGALVGFVFDQSDKLVPGRTIVARSKEEYDTLYKKTLEDLGTNSGYTIRDREQLESLRDIWDEAQMDWIDPGISPATNIGTQKGGLTGAYVKQGAFNEALDWVKRKAIVQSQDTLANLMDETLLYTRARAVAEQSTRGNKGARNVWHEYERALRGGSAEFAETGIIDKAFRKAEESINKVLANSSIMYPARWAVDLAQRIGMNPNDFSGKRTYAEISKAMGKYTPFNNAVEFMESRGVKRPPTVKGISQTMNSLAASVLLRWFELPHATVNMLGLIATMPAAVFASKAPISTFTTVKGERLAMIDGAQIIAQGMKDMFTKRGSADFKYMVRMGDATQSTLEYHEALGAIQSQAGMMKWAKNIDKWASIASDTSESWSRQIAHFVGLRLADYHGIEGMAARHNFAREIANSAIADYAPVNRPELFGSGFGSMFGLFQSYALNHYTKMFRWMENGEYAKVGIQAALQATMFGATGTYGFGQLMDFRDSLLSDSAKDPTALDMIYEHFGPVLGGAIAHGSVSQLSQLAMWSRGDTNFRVPGMSGTLAPFDIGTKVARGFTDGVAAALNAMPGERVHAAMEIVQREMPNRVMRSWLTLMNGGKEVDAYGAMMSDTKTWMDVVARSVGLRSTRQQAELEAYYSGKGAMERDAAKMEKVRNSFRAAVRNNSGNVKDVNPIQYFNDYVEAGGNPRLFRNWLKDQIRSADSPRSLQALKGELASPKSALEVWRYGAYGAWSIRDGD